MSISVSGAGEAQLHHRQQAVPAGDEPRLRSVAFEQRQRVIHAGGALVLERRGYLHVTPSVVSPSVRPRPCSPAPLTLCTASGRPYSAAKRTLSRVPACSRPPTRCHAVAVTLTQLEAFVLVARLGSVKAAAQALNVSEPAVSGALAALRQHLGDPLVTRTAGRDDADQGGQRLVSIASRMINLAAEAEVAVRQEAGAPERLRVVATSTVAEFAVPAAARRVLGPGRPGRVERRRRRDERDGRAAAGAPGRRGDRPEADRGERRRAC